MHEIKKICLIIALKFTYEHDELTRQHRLDLN
jgi:hypothetical protein